MSYVCKYIHQCLDRDPDKGLCIINPACRECANNPYSQAGHYFEPIKDKATPLIEESK